MGLFGFGKKKHQSKEALEAAAGENEEAVDAAENVDEAQEVVALPEPSAEYEGRGDEHGPWDVEDENVPDYDEYLDMGSYYLPFLKGIELRVKANRATQQVLGTTITYGSSSVEIEASFAKIEAEPKLPFADVSSGDWYYDAVVYVYKNGLMDGTGPAVPYITYIKLFFNFY